MSVLAIDLGLKRIGLAVELKGVRLPLDPIIRINRNQAAKELDELLLCYEVDTLVIGVPIGGQAEASFKRQVEHFSKLLCFTGSICLVDESFSSKEAAKLQATSKKKRSKSKDGKLDSLAALLILERFCGV